MLVQGEARLGGNFSVLCHGDLESWTGCVSESIVIWLFRLQDVEKVSTQFFRMTRIDVLALVWLARESP